MRYMMDFSRYRLDKRHFRQLFIGGLHGYTLGSIDLWHTE